MEAVAVVAGIATTVLVLMLLARRARRRGIAGAALAGAMAAYDEAWHPTAFAAHAEMLAQADRAARCESPEDL